MVSTVLQARLRVKYAAHGDVQLPDEAVKADAVAAQNSEAWRKILGATVGMAGLGIAGRSAMGLAGLIHRNVTDPPNMGAGPIFMQMPVPVEEGGEPSVPAIPDKKKRRGQRLSLRPSPVGAGVSLGSSLFARKSAVVDPRQTGLYTLGMGLGGLGGFVGGWKLTDWLLAKRRKAELHGELADSEAEFQKALASQFDHPVKLSSDEPESLGSVLDRLYDGFTKLASTATEGTTSSAALPPAPHESLVNSGLSALGRMGNVGLDYYTGYAGLTALLAGTAGYEMAQRRGQQAILRKAMKKRQREEYMRRPTDLFAAPQPVRMDPTEELEEKLGNLKFSNDKEGASLIPARLIREFAPVRDRREDFTPDEEDQIEQGESQWVPEVLQTDATPLAATMASPTRQGLLAGGLGAAGGGALGHLAGGLFGKPEMGTAIGAGVGSLAGLLRGISQYHHNADLKETMRRLPPGATKRDLMGEEAIREALMHRLDMAGNSSSLS